MTATPNDVFGAIMTGIVRAATSISASVCRERPVVPTSSDACCSSAMRAALRAPSSEEKSMTASMGAPALLAGLVLLSRSI